MFSTVDVVPAVSSIDKHRPFDLHPPLVEELKHFFMLHASLVSFFPIIENMAQRVSPLLNATHHLVRGESGAVGIFLGHAAFITSSLYRQRISTPSGA
jgi:hypothetical protein